MDEKADNLAAQEGEVCDATSNLFSLVYEELKRLAASKMVFEKSDHSLQATALVHEAYVRMVDVTHPQSWDSRGHFFAAAAQAMRRILVERARKKGRIKHGANFGRQPVEDVPMPDPDVKLLELDEALSRLAQEDLEAATIVELHHFAGLSHEIVAETLKISVYQARQKWSFARAWLQEALKSYP